MDVPFDMRKGMEVLNDLRDSGVEAFPNVVPKGLIDSNGLTTKKGRIFPLGTISKSTTIFGNESGYYPIVKTDEHGFINPKGLYNKNKVDIVLIGDSFTEGVAVHSDESISAVLRQLELNVINLGKVGNGPLLEFATLKEYAEPLKPKIVLWLYYVNDLNDLKIETQSSFLKKYLNEDDYSQNLIFRQEEIHDVLINYVQSEFKRKSLEKNPVRRISKLYNLRTKINLTPTPTSISTPTLPKAIFIDILKRSKQMVSNWGGKMYFVYLPEFYFAYLPESVRKHPSHNFVIQTTTELEIPIIDIRKEVFDSHPDPLSLFPFRMRGHYTAEGYKFVAEAIGKRLEADGYVPIKSKK